jgi:hypothetical protein
LKAGALYFALVFAAGFALGIIRQLLVVPRLGVMWAELLEMPIMLLAIVAAARWTVRRLGVPPAAGSRVRMGLAALALLIAAELGLVLALRGLTFAEYVAQREPVSGVVYLVMLGVFAAMPALLAEID